MRRSIAITLGLSALLLSPSALAKGKLWLVVDQGTENALHAATMVEDFWACTLNATDFNDYVSKYSGHAIRAAQPLDFGYATVVDTGNCGTPDAPGWEPMLQCVINAAKIQPADGDYIHYIPPVGGFDARNCTICNVSSGGKNVSIRAGITRSGKASDFTFAGIHEAFEGVTYGGSDDCCNGYYGNNFETSSCISLWGSTGGELTVQCGYRGYQEQRVTFGVRNDNLFHGEDCTPVKVTATANTPASVCELPKAERVAGKCIGGQVVTCEYTPVVTPCADGCFEDMQGAHCGSFGASCNVSAPASACPGASVPVSVACKNVGTSTWDNTLALVTSPDTDSPIADPSWITPRSPAAVTGAPVAPGSMGTFAFTARANGTGTITQSFGFGHGDAGSEEGGVTLSFAVTPCGSPDAGDDGGVVGDPPIDVPGCSCSETSGVPSASSLVGLALVLAFSRRRR